MKSHTEIRDPETAIQMNSNAFWVEQEHQHLKKGFSDSFSRWRIAEPDITR